MKDQPSSVLFITDKKFVDYAIPGGVQLCTNEFIEYLKKAGFLVDIFKVEPVISFAKRVKLKIGIEAYDLYNIDNHLDYIVNTINSKNIKLVLFNQLNLAHNLTKIKGKVLADVKFIGLSHGNESGDYLHTITQSDKTPFLQTWRLGKLIVKEKTLFSKLLDGVITISDQETYIDQWMGAENILFLPRILTPGFVNWKPNAKTIGFVGTLDHLPNYSGIDLLSKQLQLKGFDGTIRLVGSPENIGRELERKYKFIQYCGALNDQQLVDEVSTWSIFINPVFWYARGSSTKLSQALNWGIPVLSTPAGARGYDLSNSSIITANNTPEGFAEAILKELSSVQPSGHLKQASEDNALHFNLESWAARVSIYLNSL